MREHTVLQAVSVCQDMQALTNPEVQTRRQFQRHEHEDCPLFTLCASGRLLGRNLRHCIPKMAMEVARYATLPGATLEAEMRDFGNSPAFPPMGYINPYENSHPDATIMDKVEICRAVEQLARVFMDGEPAAIEQQIKQAHCKHHESFTEGCAECRMARLVIEDATEVVRPNGVATRVPRGQCRCPITQVGDFCPVHGG